MLRILRRFVMDIKDRIAKVRERVKTDKTDLKINKTGAVAKLLVGATFITNIGMLGKAMERKAFNPDKDYHPMMLAVGSNQLLPILHDEIKKLDIGDKKVVEIPCEDAFGKRDPSLIQLIPMREFKKQNIKPFPGMPLTLSGNQGIVRTVNVEE